MATINDGTATFHTRDMRLTEQAKAMIDILYPVGIIVSTTSATAPFSVGTWEEVAQGRVLQGCADGQTPGETVEAGLPNIKTSENAFSAKGYSSATIAPFKTTLYGGNGIGPESNHSLVQVQFDASLSDPIYGNSKTVQPPAYLVHFWRRTS